MKEEQAAAAFKKFSDQQRIKTFKAKEQQQRRRRSSERDMARNDSTSLPTENCKQQLFTTTLHITIYS